MGTRRAEQSEKIARGLTIRSYPSGKRLLRLHFQYRGAACREMLVGLNPDSQNDVRYAKNLKAEIENSIARGTFIYTDFFPDSPRARLFGHAVSKATVRELGDTWLKDIERSHPHSTYYCYRKSLVGFVYPSIGSKRARDLEPEDIRQMIRSCELTLKTIRNHLTPLRAILDQALVDKIIDRNPLDKIKIAKLVDRKRAKSGYKVDPFDSDEIEAFLAACDQYRPGWTPYFQFAFFSGLRTSELYALMWSDVDWRRNRVRIERAVVERKMKETKTEAGTRDIELTPMALEALQQQRPNTALRGEFIFLNPRSNRPIRDYDESQRAFDYVLRKAGIRRRNQYQTRHTYASQMLSGGENPLFVANQMGHTDVQMALKVYAKWVEQGQDKSRHAFVSDFGTRKSSPSIAHAS